MRFAVHRLGHPEAYPRGERTRPVRRSRRRVRILAAACAIACALLPAAVASGATQAFTDSVALQRTNWTDSVTVPKFDPLLGRLQEVRLAFLGHVEGDLRVESLDSAPATVTSELRSEISLRRPDSTPMVVSFPAASRTTSLSSFDGATDFAGTSGREFLGAVADDSESAVLSSPADLALFTASSAGEDITLPVDAVGRSTATGAGNLVAQFQTSASADVTVTYVYNAVPVAEDDSATTLEERPVSLDVLSNDRDPDGSLDPASVAVTSGPANGSTSVTPSTGAITYLPDAGFTGTDTFTYQVCDTGGVCTTADVTATVEPAADLAISTTPSGAFVAGENGSYALTVTNNGPSPAVGVTVTDTLPDGLEFSSATGTGWICSASGRTVTCTNPGPLADGASSTIALTAAVGDTPASVTNTASVSALTGDPEPANNSASDTAAVQLRSDLSITSRRIGAFAVGATGRYEIRVTNNGPSSAVDLVVSDTLPDGLEFSSATGAGWTCSASGQTVTCSNPGPLAPGTSSTIALRVKVKVTAAAGNSITNTARLSAAVEDPSSVNNDTTSSVTVSGAVVSDRARVTPSAELPATGAAVLPLVATGLALTLAGCAALRWSRRDG